MVTTRKAILKVMSVKEDHGYTIVRGIATFADGFSRRGFSVYEDGEAGTSYTFRMALAPDGECPLFPIEAGKEYEGTASYGIDVYKPDGRPLFDFGWEER